MSDFVGTTPFLKIALWVAMETMHFHIAGISIFLETFSRIQGGPTEQFGTNEKLSWGGR